MHEEARVGAWSGMHGCVYWCLCFFKQKTAYEMRISDWSSDVCSSDLLLVTTGLRLEEASHLLAAEIPVCDARSERQRRVELPAALTKGDRGRSMLLPRRLLPVFDAYIAVERDRERVR